MRRAATGISGRSVAAAKRLTALMRAERRQQDAILFPDSSNHSKRGGMPRIRQYAELHLLERVRRRRQPKRTLLLRGSSQGLLSPNGSQLLSGKVQPGPYGPNRDF